MLKLLSKDGRVGGEKPKTPLSLCEIRHRNEICTWTIPSALRTSQRGKMGIGGWAVWGQIREELVKEAERIDEEVESKDKVSVRGGTERGGFEEPGRE